MHDQYFALTNLNLNLQSCAKACFSLLQILRVIRRFSRREESSVAEIHTRTPVLAEDTELGVGRLTGDIVEVIIIIVKPWPQTPKVKTNKLSYFRVKLKRIKFGL